MLDGRFGIGADPAVRIQGWGIPSHAESWDADSAAVRGGGVGSFSPRWSRGVYSVAGAFQPCWNVGVVGFEFPMWCPEMQFWHWGLDSAAQEVLAGSGSGAGAFPAVWRRLVWIRQGGGSGCVERR